jgi:hypothetical protein
MTRTVSRLVLVFTVAAFVAPPAAAAQPAPAAAATPAGHWEGAIETPNGKLDIAIDLRAKGDAWEGTISIPTQNLKSYPLTKVAAKGDSLELTMAAPGNPVFTGRLDPGGQAITGDFTQGGGVMSFSLSRKGEARFEPVVESSALGKEFEGEWAGTLEVSGKSLRLLLKLAVGPDGRGRGALVSLDQGGVEIPIQTVTQSGAHLVLLIPTIAGSFTGDLKDGQIPGRWKQAQLDAPLVFTRATK